jgi:predicted DNA-binding protein (MmcQ/YjbR family)
MDIEWIRAECLRFPDTAEEIKWGHDLCIMVRSKIFCVLSLDEDSLAVTIKVLPEEANSLIQLEAIEPAPYLARYHWVTIRNSKVWNTSSWHHYLRQSYDLIAKTKKTVRQKKN